MMILYFIIAIVVVPAAIFGIYWLVQKFYLLLHPSANFDEFGTGETELYVFYLIIIIGIYAMINKESQLWDKIIVMFVGTYIYFLLLDIILKSQNR
jgi:hypothetical protein